MKATWIWKGGCQGSLFETKRQKRRKERDNRKKDRAKTIEQECFWEGANEKGKKQRWYFQRAEEDDGDDDDDDDDEQEKKKEFEERALGEEEKYLQFQEGSFGSVKTKNKTKNQEKKGQVSWGPKTIQSPNHKKIKIKTRQNKTKKGKAPPPKKNKINN